MFINYNPNPLGKNVDDCAIRAVSKVLNISWDSAYDKLVVFGKSLGDLPNSNEVIDALLQFNGFKRYSIPNTCPFCYQARGPMRGYSGNDDYAMRLEELMYNSPDDRTRSEIEHILSHMR